MGGDQTPRLSIAEARGLMLAAQGLLDPPPVAPGPDAARAAIERLGALQIDTISVVARTQYLVLWSRLGPYPRDALDGLLYPRRETFEYWSHAASIVPMADYRYYRPKMLCHHEHMWSGNRQWLEQNPAVLRETRQAIRERGPLGSADFERPPDKERTGPWDWFGPKDSRRALEILWTMGDLMVHSRRAGQKVYDLRERVLAEAFGGDIPPDEDLPSPDEVTRYFARRTLRALGIVTPSWLWDYFRLSPPAEGARSKRVAALALLNRLREEGEVVQAAVDGLGEPAFVTRVALLDLERLRSGVTPERTTLLSPFDSLIWDRARARTLFDYEVCFEAYVPPPKRRYGYYCLSILHRGRLVGRLDPKMDRATRRLIARAVYLEPGVAVDDSLLDGVAGALRSLARFLGADTVVVERADPALLAPA
nr:winged helix DNA-binding domain-containing protein [Chloroflexota bacterium]